MILYTELPMLTYIFVSGACGKHIVFVPVIVSHKQLDETQTIDVQVCLEADYGCNKFINLNSPGRKEPTTHSIKLS